MVPLGEGRFSRYNGSPGSIAVQPFPAHFSTGRPLVPEKGPRGGRLGWGGKVIWRKPGLPKAGESFVLIYLFEIINGKVLTGLNLQRFLPRDFKGTPHADTQRGLVRIGHAQMNVASSVP